MSREMTFEIPQTDAELSAAIDAYLDQLKQVIEETQRDNEETERLAKETQAILKSLRGA